MSKSLEVFYLRRGGLREWAMISTVWVSGFVGCEINGL